MTTALLINIAKGVGYGASLTNLAREERMLRDGESYIPVALLNSAGLYRLLEAATDVAKHYTHLPITFLPSTTLSTLAIISTTFCISIAYEKIPSDYRMTKRVISLLYHSVSSVIQLASMATHIALLYFGGYATAIPAVTLLSLGYLERNRFWISDQCPCVKKYLEHLATLLKQKSLVILVACDILDESLLTRMFAIYSTSALIINTLFPNTLLKKQAKPEHKITDSATILRRAEAEGVHLHVNMAHADYETLIPELPSVDYKQIFIDFYNEIDWDEGDTQARVERRLNANKKYQHILNKASLDPASVDHAYRKAHIFKVLNEALDAIINQSIPSGIISYQITERYLKNVAKVLKDKNDLELAKNAILKISCEAFDFCGDASQRVSYELYELHCLSKEADSLGPQSRLFTFLQQLRLRRFTAIAHGALKNFPLITDPADIHDVSLVMCAYGPNLGLPQIVDMESITEKTFSLDQELILRFARPFIEKYFFRMYTAAHIIEEVRDACRLDNLLSQGELFEMTSYLFGDDPDYSKLTHPDGSPTDLIYKCLLISQGVLY